MDAPSPFSLSARSDDSCRRPSPDVNRLNEHDRPAHDWYRFVLSFPPHVVRKYVERFQMAKGDRLLDPFCGTGTTVVEGKKLGLDAIGIEAHPMAHFAAKTKVSWNINASTMLAAAERIAEVTAHQLKSQGIVDDPQPFLIREEPSKDSLLRLPFDRAELLLTDSISPLPLHKTLVLLAAIERHGEGFSDHLRLALARELVAGIGNLHFGPEVGVGPAKKDTPVVSAWLSRIGSIADDLETLHPSSANPATVYHSDSRSSLQSIAAGSIDAVITSPPYPNEKDYTRTTRLESVLLGFIRSKVDLQKLKRNMLLRSNTRNVYKGDDDDRWVAHHPEIQQLAFEIEARRIALGKTSGFERLYAKVTRLYFGGIARHLAELRPLLRPGACLAYVVGDQASYLRVMIRTGQILASLAEELGYQLQGIDLFRTRLATATKQQLREEVVLLRWPGKKSHR